MKVFRGFLGHGAVSLLPSSFEKDSSASGDFTLGKKPWELTFIGLTLIQMSCLQN